MVSLNRAWLTWSRKLKRKSNVQEIDFSQNTYLVLQNNDFLVFQFGLHHRQQLALVTTTLAEHANLNEEEKVKDNEGKSLCCIQALLVKQSVPSARAQS